MITMTFKNKWFVLWSLWAARVARQPTLTVRTSSGWLRGSIAHSGTHAHYLGIPYATLQGRFQAPGPEPTWTETFEAINENVRCIQPYYMKATTAIGQEDCLVLNIYTPLNIPPDKHLPVMVFIHGGGFSLHDSSRMMYGPEYMVPKGVILVTLNYRLNIQGFLCLGIKEAPGNAGMKDQVAALKWISNNIRAFGGDHDNVTVFGESAGGASVALHVLSRMSKGFFHKAIVQSGSSLASWAFQYQPVRTASLFAEALGFKSQDPHELYDFFMSKSYTDMIAAVATVPRKEGGTILEDILFAPCAERYANDNKTFLDNLPYELLLRGEHNKVAMILGANIEEGQLLISVDQNDLIENVDFKKGLPGDLIFPTDEVRKEIAAKVKEMYMGNDEVNLNNKYKISKFYGEPLINYHVVAETQMLAKTNPYPVYHYLFGYDGGRNILKRLLVWDSSAARGATHIDDLFYLFSQQLIPSFFEMTMINKMTTMWTDFAKHGNPTPAVTDITTILWPAVTIEDQKALLIDRDFSLIPLWYNEAILFWEEVYKLYRRKS